MQQPRDPGPLLTTPSSATSPASKVPLNNNTSTVNNNNNSIDAAPPPTWHPHVYGKRPKSPTPHRIVDILGWMEEKAVLVPKAPPPRAANLLVVPRVSFSAQDDDEPLNLSTTARSRDASPSMTPPLGLGLGLLPPTGPFREPLNGLATPLVLNGVLNGRLADVKGGVPTVPPVRVPSVPLRETSTSSSKRRRKEAVSSTDGNASGESSLSDSVPEAAADRKRKKARTTFTGRQIFELEKQFEVKKYLSSSERAEMARLLGVTDTQVKIWFQNRRTKWKKHDNISNAEAAEHKSQQQGPAPAAPSKRPTVVVKKATSATTVLAIPSPNPALSAAAGSPFSADDHSNGSTLLTGDGENDGSVSESCMSEEASSSAVTSAVSSRTLLTNAATPSPPAASPSAASPCAASMSPVSTTARSSMSSPTRGAPPRSPATPALSSGDTPTLSATLVATPVPRDSTNSGEGEKEAACRPCPSPRPAPGTTSLPRDPAAAPPPSPSSTSPVS